MEEIPMGPFHMLVGVKEMRTPGPSRHRDPENKAHSWTTCPVSRNRALLRTMGLEVMKIKLSLNS